MTWKRTQNSNGVSYESEDGYRIEASVRHTSPGMVFGQWRGDNFRVDGYCAFAPSGAGIGMFRTLAAAKAAASRRVEVAA